MYPVSDAYQAAVKENERVWQAKVRIETAYETFELTDEDILEGSLNVKEGVLAGDRMGPGGVVASDLTIALINTDGRFDSTQFNGAVIRPRVGLRLPSGTVEYVPLGVFRVDEVGRPGATISLQAMDRMLLLERSFSGVNVPFPCTAQQLLSAVCGYCSVSVASLQFPQRQYLISNRPEGDFSCRDIVSHIAAIAGCFARFNREGTLELVWFDNPGCVLEASVDGNVDSADGGDFAWWNNRTYDGGRFVLTAADAVLQPENRLDFSVDDDPITLSGVAFETEEEILLAGHERYPVDVSGNPLIQNGIPALLDTLLTQFEDFTYMPFTTNWQGDPALQAGDLVELISRKGERYRSVVTESAYRYRGKGRLQAVGVSEIAAQRRTQTQKQTSRLERRIEEKQSQLDAMDEAIANATQLLAGALGGHVIMGEGEYEGTIFIADHEDIGQAKNIWRWNKNGFGHYSDGINSQPDTAVTADSSIFASLITADMIKTGSLNASLIKTGSLNASLLKAGEINADLITTGTINASLIKSGKINADLITAGTLDAERIKTGILKGKGENEHAYFNLDTGELVATSITDDTAYAKVTVGTFEHPTHQVSGFGLLYFEESIRNYEVLGILHSDGNSNFLLEAARANAKVLLGNPTDVWGNLHVDGKVLADSTVNAPYFAVGADDSKCYFYRSGNSLVLDAGQFDLYCNLNMNGQSILNQSDETLKAHIAPTEVYALDVLNAMALQSFDWKNTNKHEKIGFVAQQVEGVEPSLVAESADGVKCMKPLEIIPYLVKAIQELSDKVEELEMKLAAKEV